MSTTNVWGTLKADITAEEFCVECEREVPRHYDNCPTRNVGPAYCPACGETACPGVDPVTRVCLTTGKVG